MCTQSSYRTRVTGTLETLKWLTVRQRSTYILLNFVRNITVTHSPDILSQRFIAQYAQHNYQTRHTIEGRFVLPKSKSNMGQKTVMYRAMVSWNSLPVHIIQEHSQVHFKRLQNDYLSIIKYI